MIDYYNVAHSSAVTMACEHIVSFKWISKFINILSHLKPWNLYANKALLYSVT